MPPSTLAQQVAQAQRIYATWSPERKASVRLQGQVRYAVQHAPAGAGPKDARLPDPATL